MRWFKHMTATRSDEKIAAYIDKCGMEGYGVYWAILETIANVMEKSNGWKTEVTYPLTRWATILQLHRTKVSKYLGYLGGKGGGNLEDTQLLLVTYSEKGVTVKCPNLAKYKDEYSKKSGQTPEFIRTSSGQTPEQEAETETETETETEREDKDYGVAVEKPTAPPNEISAVNFLSIPLVGEKEFFVTEDMLSEFEKCYPAVDVREEIRKIRAWNFSNPTNRKTKKGILRHINSWLSTEQNKARSSKRREYEPRKLNNVEHNQLVLEKILREEEEKAKHKKLITEGNLYVTH